MTSHSHRFWRFPFMARSVMGFLASSLNLATGHHPHHAAEDPAGENNDDDLPGHVGMRRPLPALLQPTQPYPPSAAGAPRAPLRERRAQDRRNEPLHITGPAGWRRRHSSANHITEYFTRNLKAGIASFVVPPPVDFIGTPEAFQQGMVRRVSEGMPVVEGSTRTGTAGSFDFISFEMKPPWGAPRRVVLYTALWTGKGQLLLFGADCDPMFEANVLVAHALVQKIVVPDLRETPASTADLHSFTAQ